MTKEEIPQMQLLEAKEKNNLSSEKSNEATLSDTSGGSRKKLDVAGRPKGKALQVRSAQNSTEPSVALMLQKVIDGGITKENVSALESLVGLYDRMQAKNAEREFSAALVELQGETIRVQATKSVDVRDGIPRYKFAPYEEIMSVVQPMLTRHGFSVTFDTRIEADRLYSVCTLTHKSGHSRSNQFAVRFSKPPGSSDPQGDMSTKNYAKRGAFCDCLNISIEHDDDARMIGRPIGKALAEDLEKRVKACGADEHAFMKFAGVNVSEAYPVASANYGQISDERWPVLDELLKRKELAKAAREKLSPEGDQWK